MWQVEGEAPVLHAGINTFRWFAQGRDHIPIRPCSTTGNPTGPDLVFQYTPTYNGQAQIQFNNTYRAYAVSPAGAIGLMQVMPATGRWFGEKLGKPVHDRAQLFDPERNIELGVHYLAELHRQFGRLDLALLAYNAGPRRARQIARGPEERLARWLEGYAGKVIATHRRLQAHVASR